MAENGLMTSTIVVTNDMSSTSAATGTIRVTDTLSVHETYVSFSGTGWSAVDTASGTLVFGCTGANLARGASLPPLAITTRAETGYLGDITNRGLHRGVFPTRLPTTSAATATRPR